MTIFEKMRTPSYIFVVYLVSSSLIIIIFRLIFPPEAAPLVIYSRNWRFIQGALELFNLFPALAFSALVIPFGIVSGYEENFQSFSEMFFKKLSVSVILAVAAAVIYGLIFFLALPVVKNKEENMRYSGDLYRTSRRKMQERRDKGEWKEAAQYLRICENIWYNNKDIDDIRAEINSNMDRIKIEELKERQEARESLSRSSRSAGMSAISGNIQPVNAAESMSMAEAAFNERRFFDAHWLATLAGRLAIPGSPEVATSARLAVDAWNEISSLAPNSQEEKKYKTYTLKLEGYQAMNNGDWIRAYYIFQDLSEYNHNDPNDLYDPDDPDVKNFLIKSEIGTKETAFFIDEMEPALGEILTGAVFSLPLATASALASEGEAAENNGRAVLRFNSLTTSDDIAYGMGLEYMSFDQNSNLTASVQSRYAKITPVRYNDTSQILILMHALDRDDENTRYDSQYLYGIEKPGGLVLDISFEDLFLLSGIRHGLANLAIGDLFEAAKKTGNMGYVHQIFEAEILNRLGSVLFFLPMAIFTVVIGWRYRAKKKPRYLFGIMLFVLPIVFNGFVFLYRSIINTLGIWLVLSMGFAGALAVYIAVLTASLFAALIALAAQHT